MVLVSVLCAFWLAVAVVVMAMCVLAARADAVHSGVSVEPSGADDFRAAHTAGTA